MIRLKSLITETFPSDARFGLGNVAENGAVAFKEYSYNDFREQIHGKRDAPWGRNTFRYMAGVVDWSDGHPNKDVKQTLENWLERRGYPFKRHKSAWDNYGPPDDFQETYYSKMSDDEKTQHAMTYFDIGHDNSEDEFGVVVDATNYCWIWDKGTQSIDARKGGTHNTNFGTSKKDYTFSGWYDEAKDKISVVFPDSELRKLGHRRPTVDDIPNQIYQALIRKFGKRKPTMVVFESTLRSQLKRLIKEIASIVLEGKLRGEWWFQDGQAVFADGDVGDMNHEAIVIDTLRRQVLDALDVDTGNFDYVPDIGDGAIRDQIFQNIHDELTPEELEGWENSEYYDVIASYLIRKGGKDIKEIMYYLRGHDDKGKSMDVREYALIHWGWQRVKGNVIQTQTITSKDLQNIVSGLWEAYENDIEDKDQERVSEENPFGEQTFDIEVNSTRSWYQGVPWSVLEKKNPMALNPYRTRYE